jgi:hypothetical protein
MGIKGCAAPYFAGYESKKTRARSASKSYSILEEAQAFPLLVHLTQSSSSFPPPDIVIVTHTSLSLIRSSRCEAAASGDSAKAYDQPKARYSSLYSGYMVKLSVPVNNPVFVSGISPSCTV